MLIYSILYIYIYIYIYIYLYYIYNFFNTDSILNLIININININNNLKCIVVGIDCSASIAKCHTILSITYPDALYRWYVVNLKLLYLRVIYSIILFYNIINILISYYR